MNLPPVSPQYPAPPIAPLQTTGFAGTRTASARPDPSEPSPSTATAATPPLPPEHKKAALESAVKAVQDFVKPMSGNLEFSLDDETGQTVIKVIDSSTKELIRQIPSEEMLEIARALDRLQGLLVRQKA